MNKAERILYDLIAGTGPIRSFREAYAEITGDRKVSGRVEDCNRAKMGEAFAGDIFHFTEAVDTTAFSNVLGATVNRMMLEEYRKGGRYDAWKRLASVANAADFRTKHCVRYGGYGDLPAVGQGENYPALISPADEATSYGITKRGGVETVTLEAIRNDDVQFIQRLPKRLAEAAHRTLSKFVLGFLRDNPVIYDGLTLFHASHGNLATADLSAVSLEAGRAAMRKQKELSSNDPLNIAPRCLFVPLDLEETAFNLFQRGANLDKTFSQSNPLDVVRVWYWSDPDDWCLSADPAACPTIEVGFLDGNEEPEIFAQDMPSVGSLFSNDVLTYKVRHIYGGAVTDFRGLYKSVKA